MAGRRRQVEAGRLTGVLCAMVTPFTAGLELDHAGLRENAARLAAAGIGVFVVNSTIGEVGVLSREEQREVVRHAAETVGESVLIAGSSHPSPQVVADQAESAARDGAGAVMVQPPAGFRLTHDEMLAFFADIDARLSVPFIVYHNPAAGSLEPATIAEVARLRHFLALKEASTDVVRFHELIDRFGARFPVIAAAEDVLLYTLVSGAPACMTASAAFAPRLLAELFTALQAGDLAGARRLFARVWSFRRLFQSGSRAGRPAYISYTKAAVEILGGHAGPPRPPLRPLTDLQRAELTRVLQGEVGLEVAQRPRAGTA